MYLGTHRVLRLEGARRRLHVPDGLLHLEAGEKRREETFVQLDVGPETKGVQRGLELSVGGPYQNGAHYEAPHRLPRNYRSRAGRGTFRRRRLRVGNGL